MDTVVQENASVSEELASTAEELASQAKHLQDTIGFFKTGATKKNISEGAAKVAPGKGVAEKVKAATAAKAPAPPARPAARSRSIALPKAETHERKTSSGDSVDADFEEF
jgi:methyl-accepting chemotaxis protein